MSIRTTFLIDGFNIYHSVLDIETRTGLKVKWLNYFSLCSSYLHIIGEDATLEAVYYFSALAYHLHDPGIISHHEDYIRCLETTGVEVRLGRFKPRDIKCPLCRGTFTRNEEKETDVAIASKMLEVLAKDECDYVVLVTGDTDLAPAVRTAKCLYPKKRVVFAFPHGRKNEELAIMAPGSFKIHTHNYAKHQFPDPFVLSDGTKIAKPPSW